MTIPTHLIENALNLTGKTMEDMIVWLDDWYEYGFSIEKFSYFLLSPSFIEKYQEVYPYVFDKYYFIEKYSTAIHEYQRKDKEFPDWNPQPLISLLEKIPWNYGSQKN